MVVRISARISKRYIVARRCFEFTPFDKKWDGPPFHPPPQETEAKPKDLVFLQPMNKSRFFTSFRMTTSLISRLRHCLQLRGRKEVGTRLIRRRSRD